MDLLNGNTSPTRRDLLGWSLASGLPVVHGSASPNPGRPHILLLMADQYRADCVGAGGNRVIHTPHLDRIAHEGVLFRRAYSCTPTCTPARAALLTGLSPWHHGVLGTGMVGETYRTELPRLLREAGYYTFGIGKMHWHPQRTLHGFHQVLLDESGRAEKPEFRSDYRAWFWSQAPAADPDVTGLEWNDYRSAVYALPEHLHPTRWMGDTAVSFLGSYARPQPFFLKVSFARPHSPYDPPERFWKRYQSADLPQAAVGKWAARYRERSDDTNHPWHGDMGAEQVRRSRQGYYGSVSFVDEQVGRILEALEKRGWLDRTLILFTADHGDMTGDHNLWRKSYAYESSARIPMLMRWPWAPRGQVLSHPVELRDILPTCLDAASVPLSTAIDGRSLLAPAGDRRAPWREFIDLEHDICYHPSNHWNALTDGHLKYIFHARDGEEQLFDLDKDPAELNDVAADPAYQPQLGRWRNRLIEHFAKRGDRWVKNGKLQLRPERQMYSPLHPSSKNPSA